MVLYNFLEPADYIKRHNHTTLRFNGLPELGDLEKAIAGYVILSSPIDETNNPYKNTTSFNNLRELVFEYFKMFYPKIAKELLTDSKRFVEQVDCGRSLLDRHQLEELRAQFRKLTRAKISDVTYAEFEPVDLVALMRLAGATRFREMVKSTIDLLISMGVLQKHPKLSRDYVSINPHLKYSWPKRQRFNRNI